MARFEVRLVNETGRTIGFGDRWLTHRVREGPDGPILGQRHLGITIACVDDAGGILVAHRRHRIFDKVWKGSRPSSTTRRSPVANRGAATGGTPNASSWSRRSAPLERGFFWPLGHVETCLGQGVTRLASVASRLLHRKIPFHRDRKSTRLNSSHPSRSRMPSSA